MKPTVACLSIFAVGLISLAQTASAAGQRPQTPTITGTLNGPPTVVIEAPKDSCDPNDAPDAMARAFRDSSGTVHMIAASTDLFENLGPTLDSVQHNCEAAFRSVGDPNPADYNDQIWIDSFYTLDGNTVAGLSHTEYHGWAHPGECHAQGNSQYTACEYDSDTYHQSEDGGYHFHKFEAPNNLVAEVPYRYDSDHGPTGYSIDTNIIQLNGWYYAVSTSWTWPPNCSGGPGPHHCIISGGAPIRTQNVLDPSSWRGWNGSDFSLTFIDPYVGKVEHPEQHVYAPVPYMFCVNAINIFQYNGQDIAVATLWDYWDNELGVPGLYLTTSADMVNWTTPTLVATVGEFGQPNSDIFSIAYFSLIDPNAPDMNFSIVGNEPDLYYVRINNLTGERELFRQPIQLTVNQ